MKKKSRRPRMEFSKWLVIWALTVTTLCIIASYVLAFQYKDADADVTIAVISTCVAIAVSYEAKSFGEKNSRNKYNVDRNGAPVSPTDEDNNAVG